MVHRCGDLRWRVQDIGKNHHQLEEFPFVDVSDVTEPRAFCAAATPWTLLVSVEVGFDVVDEDVGQPVGHLDRVDGLTLLEEAFDTLLGVGAGAPRLNAT